MPIPGAFLGPQETIRASIAQGTLFAYPRIHSLWHIVSHPRSPLGPYGMGHCQPPGFHGLWNIRAILAEWEYIQGKNPPGRVFGEGRHPGPEMKQNKYQDQDKNTPLETPNHASSPPRNHWATIFPIPPLNANRVHRAKSVRSSLISNRRHSSWNIY